MVLKIDKKTSLKMIEKYFKEQMDFDGRVTASPEIGWDGYGMNEHQVCKVFFKIRGKMKLLGNEVDAKLDVSDQEVNNAIAYCLMQDGYVLDSYELDCGLSSHSAGYGVEFSDSKPYFSGMEITIKEKTKKMEVN